MQVKMSEKCNLSGRQVLGVGKVDMSHLSSIETNWVCFTDAVLPSFFAGHTDIFVCCERRAEVATRVSDQSPKGFISRCTLKQNRICPFEHTQHFEHGT